MDEYRKARVLVQGIEAGVLSETQNGYSFIYHDEYVRNNYPAVSLTLPLSQKEYSSNVLFPFFDGIIPEGWLLDVVVHNWKLNERDRFGILLVACKDCIGDVQILREVQQ